MENSTIKYGFEVIASIPYNGIEYYYFYSRIEAEKCKKYLDSCDFEGAKVNTDIRQFTLNKNQEIEGCELITKHYIC